MSTQHITPYWRPSVKQQSGKIAYRAFYYLVMALFIAVVVAYAVDLPWAGALTWVAVSTFLGGVAIFIAIAVTSIRRHARHRAEQIPFYRDFARRQNWDFQQDGAQLAERFPDGVRPFRSATDPDASSFAMRDVFTGSWRGKPFVAFSYSPPSQRASGTDDD